MLLLLWSEERNQDFKGEKNPNVFNWQMSSVLGRGRSRVTAYVEDSTGWQSAVEDSLPACINACCPTEVGGSHRFPPPVPLHLSTLILPELLSLHLHQGLSGDRARCKDPIPLTQARGLETDSCQNLEQPSEWKRDEWRTPARNICICQGAKSYCSS